MVDASQSKAPIFLDRDGLLPAPGLLAELHRPGLARTVTVFGQDAWLVTRAEDVRTVYGDAALFTTNDSVPIFRNDDPERADLPSYPAVYGPAGAHRDALDAHGQLHHPGSHAPEAEDHQHRRRARCACSASSRATSTIMSSWPPTKPRRPSSNTRSASGTP